MITVAHYDKKLHGNVDDCDFVVTAVHEEDQDLAETIAEKISYSGEYLQYPKGDAVQYFCVHA